MNHPIRGYCLREIFSLLLERTRHRHNTWSLEAGHIGPASSRIVTVGQILDIAEWAQGAPPGSYQLHREHPMRITRCMDTPAEFLQDVGLQYARRLDMTMSTTEQALVFREFRQHRVW